MKLCLLVQFFLDPLIEILFIKYTGNTVHIISRIVDGQIKKNQSQCQPESSQKQPLGIHLDDHAYSFKHQKFSHDPHLPGNIFSPISDGRNNNKHCIGKGIDIKKNISGTGYKCTTFIKVKEPAAFDISHDQKQHHHCDRSTHS